MTRLISLAAALLLAHLIFGGIAFAESTVTYQEHVDHPELYGLPAPAKKNIEIVISLKTPVTAEDVQAWSDWLQEQGFRIGDTGDGWMDAYVSIEDAESAFQTQIMMTQQGYYGNLSDPKIPARFGNVVKSISGLTEGFLGTYGPAKRTTPKPTSQPGSRNSSSSNPPRSHPDFLNSGTLAFGPTDEQTFYDATSLINSGTNES